MKKIFLAAIGIVCLMASCSKDETYVDPINPNEGKEVVFSSTVGEATRTLYGDEATDGKSIRVNWVDGDLISVYGTTCTVPQAEYKVSTVDEDGNVVSGQNYASDLVKTGTTGVQWSGNNTSDFYAVYPTVGANSFVPAADGNSVTVTSHVRPKQNVTFAYNSTTNTWVGQHYNGAASNPTMTDAVMYAVTTDAQSNVDTDNDGTIGEVDLKFKPFSTVLRFTFEGYQGYNADGENKVEYNSTLSVSKITLTAPSSNVAGDFALTVNRDGSASAKPGTVNTIEIYPYNLTLSNRQKVQFDVFTIPTEVTIPGASVSDALKPWIVVLETTSGNFTYNLIPKKANQPVDATLSVGQLHKLNIPLKYFTQPFEIPAGEWMKYIPRNVYITELSFPGAWYAFSSNYQNTTNFTELYSQGVRAFHIDCRVQDSSDYTTLYCAGTESGYLSVSGTKVIDKLSELNTLAKENPKEFIVAALTIAEKPNTQSVSDGVVTPSVVLAAIASNVTKSNLSQLCTLQITPNTTVSDVLKNGNLIVTVSANTNADKFIAYSSLPSTMIWSGSMASNGEYISGDIVGTTGNLANTDLFSKMLTDNIYWGNQKTDLVCYHHHAQRTYTTDPYVNSSNADSESEEYKYIPTLEERKTAINDIIEQSATIYENNKHNGWFQIGIGGYFRDRSYNEGVWGIGAGWEDGDEDWATLASSLNAYVLEKVNAKLASAPSPVGVVLMNYATTTDDNGDLIPHALTTAIFKMNTKFYLNRDHNAEGGEWPDGNPFPDVNTSDGVDEGQQGEV